ncbi:hypothetical protein K438DRAFT_1629583 [Mycena galopus ATCC 62051]|nr:hypothetical protein K438DRAFT_1629583 [Mycena galopus ATCC 62051]
MKFTFTSALLFATALSAAVVHVQAAPGAVIPCTETLETRDVYTPPVTYPHAGTVWIVGQTHNVTWNTTNPPARITNPIGQITLRKANRTTTGKLVLATNFSILLGRIEVKVPHVKAGNDYQLVLFGDSGNFSPYFTIRA